MDIAANLSDFAAALLVVVALANLALLAFALYCLAIAARARAPRPRQFAALDRLARNVAADNARAAAARRAHESGDLNAANAIILGEVIPRRFVRSYDGAPRR